MDRECFFFSSRRRHTRLQGDWSSDVCSSDLFLKGHRPVVSLKIYNVLAQLVAIPILRGSGKALDSLALSCPTTMGCAYSAYWDGYVGNTGKQALSGVYIYQLVIDGKRVTRKIVVK